MRRPILAVLALVPAVVLCGCGESSTRAVPQRSYGVQVLGPSSGPLADAMVVLPTPVQDYVTNTDASGIARIQVPNHVSLPGEVVVIAAHPDIMPEALTCPGSVSAYARRTMSTVAIPASPLLVRDASLRHLGDDRYVAESDFQHQLEAAGFEHEYSFSLGSIPGQMPFMRFFVRGLERPAQIKINGMAVGAIEATPGEGAISVREFRLGGSPSSYLHTGINVLSLRAGALGDAEDRYDDFEYCALVLYLP